MWAALITSFIAAINAWGYRPQDVNILNECLWNQSLFESDADCNDLFHHYPPKSDLHSPEEEVRLAAFNIFKLGLSPTRFKDYQLLSNMINDRWDVVALSELQHNSADILKYNVFAMRSLKLGANKKSVIKAYEKPGYLKLLHSLQKLDPTWGLIVSPIGQSSVNELYGYLYRQKNVELLSSDYCDDLLDQRSKRPLTMHRELTDEVDSGMRTAVKPLPPTVRKFVAPTGHTPACHVQLKGKENRYFSKIPMVAHFRSRGFDFNFLNLHVRFRPPGSSKGKCIEKCKTIIKEMRERLKLEAPLPISDVARFYEVQATLRAAQRIKKFSRNSRVVVAGDFNLEAGVSTTEDGNRAWEKVLKSLPGSKVFVESKTSIGKSLGLSANYDHFIFAPKDLSCDVDSIQAINFMSLDFIYADVFDYVKSPRNHRFLARSVRRQFKNRFRINKSGFQLPIWKMTRLQTNDFIKNFPVKQQGKVKRSLASASRSRYKDCLSGIKQTMHIEDGYVNDLGCQILFHSDLVQKEYFINKEPLRIYTGMVSDHLPIEMSCTTSQQGVAGL